VPPRTTDLREPTTIVRNTTIAQRASSSSVQQSGQNNAAATLVLTLHFAVAGKDVTLHSSRTYNFRRQSLRAHRPRNMAAPALVSQPYTLQKPPPWLRHHDLHRSCTAPKVDHELELPYATSPLQQQPWKLRHHRLSFTPAVVWAARSRRHCTCSSNNPWRRRNPNFGERRSATCQSLNRY